MGILDKLSNIDLVKSQLGELIISKGETPPILFSDYPNYLIDIISNNNANLLGVKDIVVNANTTLEQLNKLYTVLPEATEYTTTVTKPTNILTCKTSALNVRSGPSGSYTQIGALTTGDQTEIIETASTGWYKIKKFRYYSTSNPLREYDVDAYCSNNTSYVSVAQTTTTETVSTKSIDISKVPREIQLQSNYSIAEMKKWKVIFGAPTDQTVENNAGSVVEDTSSSTTPPSVTAGSTTVTLNSVSGDSYRSNKWRNDGKVRQGNYGYGGHVGCWFFGSQFSTYASKKISKIEILISREDGGIYGAVSHVLKTHNYTSKPSGAPSYNSWSKTFQLERFKTASIVLTSSTDIAAFKAAKGFGLSPSSQNSSNYSVCSGSCTVKITYTE